MFSFEFSFRPSSILLSLVVPGKGDDSIAGIKVRSITAIYRNSSLYQYIDSSCIIVFKPAILQAIYQINSIMNTSRPHRCQFVKFPRFVTSFFTTLIVFFILNKERSTTVLAQDLFQNSCVTNEDCQTKQITKGDSICENGLCTNPYEKGCLKVMGQKYGFKNMTRIKNHFFGKTRICNSGDYGEKVHLKGGCRQADWDDFFHLGEIRIGNNPWETSLVFTWIFQILLTEILEVPATVENGPDYQKNTTFGSFYDREMRYFQSNYKDGTAFDAILQASRVGGDCRKSNVPCAHILPDISEFDKTVARLLKGIFCVDYLICHSMYLI